jgi:hypothetical protein
LRLSFRLRLYIVSNVTLRARIVAAGAGTATGLTKETMTIAMAMTLRAVGGAVTIGR